MPRCKSGLHEWLNPRDAERCCNGYRRVLLLGDEARGNVTGIVDGTSYGYAWVPVVTDDKSSGLRCTCEYEECDASPEPGHTYCAKHLTPPEPITAVERTPGAPLDMCACGHPRSAHLARPGCLATVPWHSGKSIYCQCEAFTPAPATFARVPDCSAARAATPPYERYPTAYFEARGDVDRDYP